MKEFQMALKMQVSGAEAAQAALGGVAQKLGDQLTGIKDFTKKLGEGNETVRGYIDSAKNLIEQNPIQESLGKLSGLAQAMGLDKVSGGIEATADSLKSWTGEISGFLDQTESASELIKNVLEGDVSGAIDTVAQHIEKLSTVEGIAEAMGLESVLTSAQQSMESVNGMIGKFQEFGSGAGSAGEIVKRVLLTDTQGAIDTVRTSLGAMGNFSDLATRMGLHGVAGEIDSLTKSVGDWTGKIEDFNKRSTETATQLNTAFGNTLPPGVSKAAGAIMELTGTKDALMPMLEGIQTHFQTLTGKSFPEAFKGMQELSKEFGKGGKSVKDLAEAFKAPGGAARAFAGATGIVGAAIAGWQIGKAIGEMNVFGVKINDVVQIGMTKLMGFAEKIKNKMGITTDDEYQQNTAALEQTRNDIYLNSGKPPSAAANPAANPAADAQAKAAEEQQKQEELQKIDELNQKKLALEEKLQSELAKMRQEFAAKLQEEKAALLEKDAEEDKRQMEAAKLAEENARKDAQALKEQIEAKEKLIEQLKTQNKLLTEQAGKLDDVNAKAGGEGEAKASAGTVGLRKAPARKGAESPAATGAAGKAGEKKADPNSYRDQFRKVLDDLETKAGTMAEQVAGVFKSTIGVAVDSIANGITGLINGTMTWSQALQNVGNAILNNIITSFAKMAAQWIVNQILMATVGRILGATAKATSTTMATALAAAWAVPAFLASVASYGGAVAAGKGALSAGMAFTQGMTLVSSASGTVAAAGGSAEGGLITGPGTGTSDSIPRWLSNGEFVIPAKRVEEFGAGFFEGIRTGAISARELTPGAVSRGEMPKLNLAGFAPKVNVQSAQPKVIVVNSQEELMRVMKGSVGEEITVAHIAKNKLRLGMAS